MAIAYWVLSTSGSYARHEELLDSVRSLSDLRLARRGNGETGVAIHREDACDLSIVPGSTLIHPLRFPGDRCIRPSRQTFGPVEYLRGEYISPIIRSYRRPVSRRSGRRIRPLLWFRPRKRFFLVIEVFESILKNIFDICKITVMMCISSTAQRPTAPGIRGRYYSFTPRRNVRCFALPIRLSATIASPASPISCCIS